MHTHLEQWAANAVAPGEQLGVRCLAQGSHLSRGQFLPEPRFEPTTSDYNSEALSIRPQLPHGIIPMVPKIAVRSDVAATPGPKNSVFMSVSLISSSSNCLTLSQNHQTNPRKHIYDRQSLLEIGSEYKHQLSPVTTEKLQGLCLLLKPNPKTTASPTDATRAKRRRWRCERGQKRGAIRARLRASITRSAIPSLMLSSIRSLENKMDLIQLSQSTQHETRDCCVCFFSLKHG